MESSGRNDRQESSGVVRSRGGGWSAERWEEGAKLERMKRGADGSSKLGVAPWSLPSLLSVKTGEAVCKK